MTIAYLAALNRLGHMQKRTRSKQCLLLSKPVQSNPKHPYSIDTYFNQSYPNLNYSLAVLLFATYIMVLNYGLPK